MLEAYEKTKGNAVDYLCQCIEVAKKMKCTDVARQLEQCVQEIQALRFNIAVVGDIKRGKSTLINTLLGQEDDNLSPIGHSVCTGCITHYMNVSGLPGEETPHARVFSYNDTEPQRVDLLDVGDYIRESENKDNWRNISRIEIYGNFPLLHSCCLVDTPGANAVIERHGELVNGFLPNADAIIMAVMASQPMTASEAQMVQVLSHDEQRRIFYLLTQIDSEQPATLPQICDYVTQQIEKYGLRRPERIYQIACKPVYEAQCKHCPKEEIVALRKKWGVERLERDLESFILKSSVSGKLLVKRVAEAVAKARDFFEQRQAANRELVKLHDTDVGEMQREKERILHEYRELEKKMTRNIGKFEKEWDNITVKAINHLPDLQPKLEERIEETINKAGFLDAVKNACTLGKLVGMAVRVPLEEYTNGVTNKYERLIEKLDEDIKDDVQMFLKAVNSGSLISSGGALAAATAAAASINSAWVAGQAVVVAYNAWAAAAATASSGSIWTVIAGWFGFGSAAAESAAAAGLIAALHAAVVPIVIAIVATKLVGPAAKFFSKWASTGKVEEALDKAAKDLRAMADRRKADFLTALREKMDLTKSDVESQLEEIDRMIREADPSIKEQALLENQELDKLMEQGDSTRAQLLCIE